MKKLTLILIVIIWFPLTAQNLVPNPGFEDIIECPNAYPGNTEIHFAEPWIPVRDIDDSTSDLFHECVFEPGNDPWEQLDFYGYYYPETPPHSGLSRAHIAVFSVSSYSTREYIQVPLLENLQEGQSYNVRMYVSNQYEFSIAVDNIGALFTVDRLSIYDVFPAYGTSATNPDHAQMVEHYPQVKCDSIFTIQEDYGIIEGVFTADSAYAYMSIGIFTPDEKISYSFLNSDSINLASLIIDDISVEAVTVGLEEVIGAWSVYTVNGLMYIDPQQTACSLVLYDITGREVYRTSQELPVGGQSIITLPKLPKGIYIYTILNNNEETVFTNKIIIL